MKSDQAFTYQRTNLKSADCVETANDKMLVNWNLMIRICLNRQRNSNEPLHCGELRNALISGTNAVSHCISSVDRGRCERSLRLSKMIERFGPWLE